MRKATCIILLSWGCLLSSAEGQLADFGQNPPSLRWCHLKTPHIDLIFPNKYRNKALRLAPLLEKTVFYENRSLSVKTRPIPVILQNQGMESNAFVLLAPRRSEFYTLSPPDGEPGDWLDNLGLHEMRHVVQEDKIFGGRSIPLGETVQLGIFGLVFPPWFFEGDAVVMETALSGSGRGRLARFKREYRANLLSNKNYSYSKYYLGSIKDFVPDYYRLGYFLVGKMRHDYSDSLFNKIFEQSLRPRVWPLSTSLKKNTGYTTRRFFLRTMDSLKRSWTASNNDADSYGHLNLEKRQGYQNFLLPHVSHDTLMYLTTSQDKTPGIYLSKGGGSPKLLVRIGNQLTPHFDYAAGTLVWDELRTDPRYAYRNYSVLNSMSLKSGEIRTLTHRSRLFSPSLSNDGRSVVAVESDFENNVSLQVIDITGAISNLLPAPVGEALQFPRFDAAGTHIVCIANSTNGKSLFEYDLKTGRGTRLTKPAFDDISRPSYINDTLIAYTRSGALVENIFIFNKITGLYTQLTRSQFGASNAQYSDGFVFFNDYSANGDQIAKVRLLGNWNGKGEIKPAVQVPAPEDQIESKGPLPVEQYSRDTNGLKMRVKPYREFSHLSLPHSLVPSFKRVDLGTGNANYGLKLQSTNLLNTLENFYSAYYDTNTKTFRYEAGLTYKRYFPYISLFVDDQKRFRQARSSASTFVPYTFRQLRYNLSLQVPLLFNLRNYTYQAGAEIITSITHNYLPSLNVNPFTRYEKLPVHYTLYLFRDRNFARKDLYPVWGQHLAASYENFPFDKKIKGKVLYLNSLLYFPGVFAHHSLRVGFNFQTEDGIYSGGRNVNEIAGFNFLPANKITSTLLVDYSLPVAYPDWELGSLAYVKRVRAGLFFDAQNLVKKNEPLYSRYTSFGPDLRFDCNLLRYYFPNFQLGARYVLFASNAASAHIELLFSYSL